MCGRYILTGFPSGIAENAGVAAPVEIIPCYNISPGWKVPVIRARAGNSPAFEEMFWGIVPKYAGRGNARSIVNARAEGIGDKPSFRDSVRRRRCLVPADGFYEWSGRGEKEKEPYLFRLREKRPFCMAGIWEEIREGGREGACAIITTSANELVKPVHDRMPVIVKEEEYRQWLDPGRQDAAGIASILAPFDAGRMESCRVSRRVNSPAFDCPECIMPVD